MNNSTLQILKNAVVLSGIHSVDFTEAELANKSGFSTKEIISLIQKRELQPFFSITRKFRIKCPKCASFVEIDSDLEACFCSNCNEEIKREDVPLYSIGLNRQEVEVYLIEHLIKKFESSGWKARDSDENFCIVKKDSDAMAFSICLDGNGLKDYFTLRGWGIEYNPHLFIVMSPTFDKFISAYQDKDLKCLLINLDSLFDENFVPSLLKKVNERIKFYNKERQAEASIDIEFKKFGDLQKVLEHQEELIRMLPNRALQKTQESVTIQGRRFEKDIVKILNFTILRTKYAGGGNEPDGLGIINKHDNTKTSWFPMEIKTFTPDDENNPFYPLKEAIRQIDKYSKSLESEEITKILDVPAFLVIAYDFDCPSDETKQLIEGFQLNHNNKRLILFPLKSVIKMFRLFVENNIFSLPSDIIQKWLLRSNYISEEQVDELFKELNKHNKGQFNDQMKVLRKKTKEQGV